MITPPQRLVSTVLATRATTIFAATALAQIVPAGSAWRYLDDGSDQGAAWSAPAFDDSGWQVGSAELGYGDGDEVTVVGFGSDANNKFITTYFRRTFEVADPAALTQLSLRLVVDDGARVFLNGTEVVRQNLPSGATSHLTLADVGIANADESTWWSFAIDPALVVSGTNTLAVEVHQVATTSSDISFDLALDDQSATPVTRGPYLQMVGSDRATIRWRTQGPRTSRVRLGTDAASVLGAPMAVVDDATPTTEHVVAITGLAPGTTYFYSIGDDTQVFEGADTAHYFHTAPVVGSTEPMRVWLLGDCGTANSNQKAVRNAYLAYAGATPTDMLVLLGDNAYTTGTDAQYQTAIFDTYKDTLRTTPMWSTRGNHDSETSTYYGLVSFPMAGELGGLASGSESFYSFDRGNVHFVCLDSEGSDRSATGPMATWLTLDLASTLQPWIVAFWHHPPYTKGSHDSDVTTGLEVAMTQMRANILPILEAGGVDLVFSGHSHSYERSFLIDGHYGFSSTFGAANLVDGGDGDEDGDGAYTTEIAAHQGAVYTVAGSSGKIGGGTLDHPAMYISMAELGSVVLDVTGQRLDARFLDATGAVRDHYTVLTSDGVPNLTVTNLVAGQVATFAVDHMLPGEGAIIGWSAWGPGPTSSVFGPIAMTQPIFLFNGITAGPSGVATQPTNVPPGTTGLGVWLQGLVVNPTTGDLELTTPLAVVVQ